MSLQSTYQRIFSINLNVYFVIFSFIPLGLAYFLEIFYYVLPCSLCLLQRIPFALIALLSLINLKCKQKFLSILMILLLILNACIAFYNTGVELSWFESNCALNAKHWYDMFLPKSDIPCNMPFIQLFGFMSMAFLNIIYCLFGAIFGIIHMLKNRIALQ